MWNFKFCKVGVLLHFVCDIDADLNHFDIKMSRTLIAENAVPNVLRYGLISKSFDFTTKKKNGRVHRKDLESSISF